MMFLITILFVIANMLMSACSTQYHGKVCNTLASPLCPFQALPLQSVEYTRVKKLQ